MPTNLVSYSAVAFSCDHSMNLGSLRLGMFEYRMGVQPSQRATAFYAGPLHTQVPLSAADCLMVLLVIAAAIATFGLRAVLTREKRNQ